MVFNIIHTSINSKTIKLLNQQVIKSFINISYCLFLCGFIKSSICWQSTLMTNILVWFIQLLNTSQTFQPITLPFSSSICLSTVCPFCTLSYHCVSFCQSFCQSCHSVILHVIVDVCHCLSTVILLLEPFCPLSHLFVPTFLQLLSVILSLSFADILHWTQFFNFSVWVEFGIWITWIFNIITHPYKKEIEADSATKYLICTDLNVVIKYWLKHQDNQHQLPPPLIILLTLFWFQMAKRIVKFGNK